MSDSGDLAVQVLADAGDDARDLEELTALLRDELLELDILGVQPRDEEPPANSKGLASAGSWLVVHLGPAALRSVVRTIAEWATRNNKSVELTVGGDSLKVHGATREQVDRALDEWFSRHPAGA